MWRVLGALMAATVVTCQSSPSFYETWMGEIMQAVPDVTLMDITLPGTHDSMTWDLSEKVGQNTAGVPEWVGWLLHDFLSKGNIASFIRDQSKTQFLNLTAQLNAGVRFIDFRVDYTRGPQGQAEDWYCLHFLETNHRALEYLQQLRQWLDTHPSEVVVLWLSRHSSTCATGTDAYPGTTPQVRQRFWKQITQLFDGMLVDTRKASANETALRHVVDQGQRVFAYAGDWQEFTGASPFAYDACSHIDIVDPPTGVQDQPKTQGMLLDLFANSTRRHDDRSRNVLMQVFLSTSTPTDQVKASALLRFQPLDHVKIVQECVESLHLPNLSWCPPVLADLGQLSNYYLQRVLSQATLRHLTLPNVLYVDQLDVAGTIAIGQRDGVAMRYGWVAQIVLNTLDNQCHNSTACTALKHRVEALSQQHPAVFWNDPTFGHLTDWPPFE